MVAFRLHFTAPRKRCDHAAHVQEAHCVQCRLQPQNVSTSAVCTSFAGETISEEYTLEYGSDKIEMHVGAVTAG